MGGLVNCVKCSGSMSKSADTCPKCGYPAPQNIAHCRDCKNVLPRSKHRYRTSYSFVHVVNGQGGTSGGRTWAHVPCPYCGSKQPLREIIDTPIGKILIFLIGAACILGVLALLVAGNQIGKYADSSTGAALEVGAVILVGMIGFGFVLTQNTAGLLPKRSGTGRRLIWIVLIGGTLIAAVISIAMKIAGPLPQQVQAQAQTTNKGVSAKHHAKHARVSIKSATTGDQAAPSTVDPTSQ